MQRQDLDAEIKWWKNQDYFDSRHWSSKGIFASRYRHWTFSRIDKVRFYSFYYDYVKRYLPKDNSAKKVCFAPIGDGKDFYFVKRLFKKVYGIDISSDALRLCPKPVVLKQGDILDSGYTDEYFDSILCVNFLHHVHKVGFEPFLREFYRILKHGGVLAILEPSSLSPWYWITFSLRKVLGNVTKQTEDELPFMPGRLTLELRKIGYQDIKVRATHFAHPRFYAFIQHLFCAIDYPFRLVWPFRNFAHGIGWCCTKPGKK